MFLWAPWCTWQGVMLCESHFVADKCLRPHWSTGGPAAGSAGSISPVRLSNRFREKPAKPSFRLKAALFSLSCVHAVFFPVVFVPPMLIKATCSPCYQTFPEGCACFGSKPRAAGVQFLLPPCESPWAGDPSPGGSFPSIPSCSARCGGLSSRLSPLEVPFPRGS